MPFRIGTFTVVAVRPEPGGGARYVLGRPDAWASDAPPELIFRPDGQGPSDPIAIADLGGGWWASFDPT